MQYIFIAMKYTLVNRKQSTYAKSNAEFVKWMRRQDLQYFEDNAEFMQAYAVRKATFEDLNLRFENEDVFVEDLILHKKLTVEEQPKWKLF